MKFYLVYLTFIIIKLTLLSNLLLLTDLTNLHKIRKYIIRLKINFQPYKNLIPKISCLTSVKI